MNMSSFGSGTNYGTIWYLAVALLLSGCSRGPIVPLPSDASPTLLEESTTLREVPFAAGTHIDEIFPLLIAEERVAIAARDLGGLAALWDTNAQIIDQRGTDEPEDDYIWRGISAILDRYEVAVFPFDPPPIDPPTGLVISCHSEQSSPPSATNQPAAARATSLHGELPCLAQSGATHGATDGDTYGDSKSEDEQDPNEDVILDVSNGGDLWSFVYRGGRWWIWSLKYN